MTFQVAPAVAAEDPLLVTEVLDAVEAELEERKLTLGLGLDEFQRLGRWYGDDIAWQLKELLEQGALHQRQWDRLTDVARGVVIALVAAPEAQLLAAKTLTDFSLGPKSTVSSTLDDLIE